jgi:dephospho-CoA kinase
MRIGITGGIGSGKTFVCRQIEKLGYPVFYADEEAKSIMVNDEVLVSQIKQLIGNDAYTADGLLNKEIIAKVIFSDDEKRNQMNDFVHPAVYRAFDEWAKQQTSKLAFIESALMIDTGNYQELDAVILVVADITTRIERIMQRENSTEAEVLRKINSQTSDEFKRRFSDYVIMNTIDNDVNEQLTLIINKLKSSKNGI